MPSIRTRWRPLTTCVLIGIRMNCWWVGSCGTLNIHKALRTCLLPPKYCNIIVSNIEEVNKIISPLLGIIICQKNLILLGSSITQQYPFANLTFCPIFHVIIHEDPRATLAHMGSKRAFLSRSFSSANNEASLTRRSAWIEDGKEHRSCILSGLQVLGPMITPLHPSANKCPPNRNSS